MQPQIVPPPVVSSQTQTAPALPPSKRNQYSWVVFTIFQIIGYCLVSMGAWISNDILALSIPGMIIWTIFLAIVTFTLGSSVYQKNTRRGLTVTALVFASINFAILICFVILVPILAAGSCYFYEQTSNSFQKSRCAAGTMSSFGIAFLFVAQLAYIIIGAMEHKRVPKVVQTQTTIVYVPYYPQGSGVTTITPPAYMPNEDLKQ